MITRMLAWINLKGKNQFYISTSESRLNSDNFHLRFMRGELNIRNEYRNALNRAGLDITAPSTPGTASSMRTNPPSYQRMHSNDSSKGNDSKDGASNGRISD